MRLLLLLIIGALALLWYLRRHRTVRPAAPALRLAGGPPDTAGDEPAAGGPLLGAIAAALRARGASVDEIERDDWGFAAAAVVAGRALTLKLGAHGHNGVGPEWLLVLDGGGDDAELRREVEAAAASIYGVRLLGWDD